MSSKKISLIIISAIILIGIITNPNSDRHKEAVKNKLNSIFQTSKSEQESDEWSQLGDAFTMMIIGPIVNNLISTDNYILFSTTKINWEGESRVIGLGAFGNVFLSKQLDEKLKKEIAK